MPMLRAWTGHAADILPVDQHLAAIQRDEAGDRAQQGRLAAAARAQQAEELAVAERHGDAVERGDRVVFLHRIGDGNGAHRSPPKR
jgi:hypothetical protein